MSWIDGPRIMASFRQLAAEHCIVGVAHENDLQTFGLMLN